jgi:hypothetical protein
MHRTTLAVRHASLATKQLSNNTLDGAATHNSEGVTPVCSNDAIFRLDTILKTNGDSFLGTWSAIVCYSAENTKYLANS